jgi:membrane-associated phospholipid phosphatase
MKIFSPLTIFLLLALGITNATKADTIPTFKANHKEWITPAALFISGSLIAGVPKFREIEKAVYNGFSTNRKFTRIDDYIQYLPALSVFALDGLGFKGKNKPDKQLLLYAGSNIIGAGVTQSLKRIVNRERPNGANRRSFPSGHTATAFIAAELLNQEFGHISPWISVAGYTTASATAYLRLYNNEHWLGDVLAGAAIGMASTKIVYWIDKKLKSNRKEKQILIAAF